MNEHVKLEASDGHKLDAYLAHPEGGPTPPGGGAGDFRSEPAYPLGGGWPSGAGSVRRAR
jgi:hypothetical protein